MFNQNYGNSCYKSIQAFGTGSAFDPKKIQLADSTPKNNSPYLHTCFEIPISDLIVPAAPTPPPPTPLQSVTPLLPVAGSGQLLFLLNTLPIHVDAVIISASMKMNTNIVPVPAPADIKFDVVLSSSNTSVVPTPTPTTTVLQQVSYTDLQSNPEYEPLTLQPYTNTPPTPYIIFRIKNESLLASSPLPNNIITVTIDYYLL